MQKIPTPLTLFMLPIFMLVLMGCPIGLDYSPAEPGSEKFNKKLIGTWRFEASDESKEAEVMEFNFARVDDKTIKATVKDRGEMYSLETNELLGYETEVDGLSVLFFKPDGEDKFYHYYYKFENDKTLIVGDISLLDGGVDAVVSNESLRTQIATSKGNPEFFKELKTYKRVK